MTQSTGLTSGGFELRAEAHGPVRTLYVSGELDLQRAPEVLHTVQRLSAPGAEIAVDLTRVSFIDSTGLRSILHGYAAAKSKGASLTAPHLSEAVRRVVEISGLRTQPPFI